MNDINRIRINIFSLECIINSILLVKLFFFLDYWIGLNFSNKKLLIYHKDY